MEREGGDGSRKRGRRVAFAEGDDSTPRGAAAASDRVTRDGNGGGPERPDNDFLDADDAEGGDTEVVEDRVADADDDDDYDDDGAVPGDDDNDAGGRRGARARGGRRPSGAASGRATGDDNDDGGGGGGGAGGDRVVAKLARVKGEVGELAEEVNDAGQAFEPFNLRDEREDGYFDAGGNYVWRKKTADDYDPWLQELDGMAATERRTLQADAARASAASGGGGGGAGTASAAGGAGDDDDDDDDDDGSDDAEGDGPAMSADARVAHLRALHGRMLDEETVAATLRRLGARAAGAAAAPGGGARGTASHTAPRAAAVDRPGFDAVTDAADALLRDGLVDVYAMRRTAVLMELNDALEAAGLPPLRPGTAAAAPPAPAPAPAPAPVCLHPQKRWRYKWVPAAGVGGASGATAAEAEFGPYTGAEMAAWAFAGYFAAASAPGAPSLLVREDRLLMAALPAAAAGADDDNDGDIFGGGGGGGGGVRTVPADAEDPPPWLPVADVRF